MFMRFAVQYLVDHKITPHVNWQWQAFEVRPDKDGRQVLTELTCLSPEKPKDGNWRLKFTHDDQILCSYKKATSPQATGEKRHPRLIVQTYLMGYRVMRNLLIAHLVDNKDIELFFEKLESEVAHLYAKTQYTFQLLDNTSIPSSFKSQKDYDVRGRTRVRIEQLKKRLEFVWENRRTLSRSEKNRQIMLCYRLFEWEKRQTNGVEMFLRKNEYSLMSIYHYTMERGKQNNVLDEIQKTNRLPDQVTQLLDQSENLDALFGHAIETAIGWLTDKKEQIDFIPLKQVRGVARKLGVPVYDQKRMDNHHVPFAIHPVLTVKALYANELLERGNFSLAAKIWKNSALRSKLPDVNYTFHKYLEHFGGGSNYAQQYRKEYRAIIGTINESFTSDGLLFLIACKYDANYQRVENMHDQEVVCFSVTIDHKRIEVFVSYKQLDDIITAIRRRTVESTVRQIFYQRQHRAEALSEVGITEERGIYRVPFTVITHEIERVYHQSLAFIHAILSWEKSIIESNAERVNNHARGGDGLPHVNFKTVLSLSTLDQSTKEKLVEIRNTALHGKIPEDWSYQEQEINFVLSPYLLEIREQKREMKERYRAG